MRKRGRPSKYRPIYCKKILKFFDIDPLTTVIDKIHKKTGEIIEQEREVTADLPTFTSFANSIGVDDDTIVEWAKKYKEFNAAYSKAKKLQENIWMLNSLQGRYNSQFSIFLGKNVFGYKDRTETEHSGSVVVIEEQPK